MLYKHKNYNEYIEAQIIKNRNKIGKVWVKDFELDLISNHIKNNISNAKFGICHGVRNGWEVAYLNKLLKFNVLGTDISPTAKQFKNVIQWDYHNVKEEWINNVDFIYTNSLDHSYNPLLCLKY